MQNNKFFFGYRQNINNFFLTLFVTVSLNVLILSIPMLTDYLLDLTTDCPVIAWEKHNGVGG